MHVNPVTCHSILCRLQNQEDVSKKISLKGKKRKLDSPQKQNPSHRKKPAISPKQSEAHETGQPLGMSDKVTDLVGYEPRLRNKKKQRVECDYCGKCFASVQILKRHQRTHNRSRAEVLKCTYCPKSFGNPTVLRRHLTIHTGEKPFQCEFCHKTFGQNSHLRRHLTIHTGEKPFQCEFCSKRFNQNSHMQSHHRVHTGEKPFQCEFCPKRFAQPGILKSHQTVHTGKKPFQCEFCNKRFADNLHVIIGCTQERSHFSVRSAQRGSTNIHIFKNIAESTQERSHSSASSATNTLDINPIPITI